MSVIRGSRALVTGGAGMIGSAIVRRLIAEGAAEVVVMDALLRGTPANLAGLEGHAALRFLQADLRDAAAVDASVKGMDFVIHQAALRVTRCEENPREGFDIMVRGTFDLFEAAARHHVRKILFASAASVYGHPLRLPVDEDHPLQDSSFYSGFKIAGESLLRSFAAARKIPYVILRYFSVYGPGMDLTSPHREVMIRWLDRLDEHKPPVIFGDGSQSVDFVYVDDVARANLRALESGVSGEAFNVGTGRETSLLELSRLILHLTRSPLTPEFQPPRPVNSPSRRFASTLKAETKLGFKASVPIEEGLSCLIEWRRQRRMASTRNGEQQP